MKLKNKTSKTDIPNKTRFDISSAAARGDLRLPATLTANLWSQLASDSRITPDDPRLDLVIRKLKEAITQHDDGRSCFSCLERGIDFDIETGTRVVTAFAFLDKDSNHVPIVHLESFEESFDRIVRRIIAIHLGADDATSG